MLSLQTVLSDREVMRKEYKDSMAKAYPVAMVVNLFTVEDADERVFERSGTNYPDPIQARDVQDS